MHPVIYDVAVSMDGYISGPDGDVSAFAHDGPVVDDYQKRLAGYDVALMGRETYAFGYRYGLQPGDAPYPHMKTRVVSRDLDLPDHGGVSVLRTMSRDTLQALKDDADGPIYLCGGGDLAGHMLARGLIDRLALKRAPILLGSGTRLFGSHAPTCHLTPRSLTQYDNGYVFQEFDVTPG